MDMIIIIILRLPMDIILDKLRGERKKEKYLSLELIMGIECCLHIGMNVESI